MSNCTLYGGVPVDKVDFKKEYQKELELLKNTINELEQRAETGNIKNYHFWTLKLNRANKALENGRVVLDVTTFKKPNESGDSLELNDLYHKCEGCTRISYRGKRSYSCFNCCRHYENQNTHPDLFNEGKLIP